MATLLTACSWCQKQAGVLAQEYNTYFVLCSFCQARSPGASTPEAAINVWNDGGAAMRKALRPPATEGAGTK